MADPNVEFLAANLDVVLAELQVTSPSTTFELIQPVIASRVSALRHRQDKAREAGAAKLAKRTHVSDSKANHVSDLYPSSEPRLDGSENAPPKLGQLDPVSGFDYLTNYDQIPTIVHNAIAACLIGSAVTTPTVELAELVQLHIERHKPEPFDKLQVPSIETIIQVIDQQRGTMKF